MFSGAGHDQAEQPLKILSPLYQALIPGEHAEVSAGTACYTSSVGPDGAWFATVSKPEP
jgi:hypothetical protein